MTAQPASPLLMWAASDVGRVRAVNQDAVRIDRVRLGGDWCAVGLVADGMGGGRRGEDASRIAADAFLDAIANRGGFDRSLVLAEAVMAANEAVLRGAQDLGLGDSQFGTTLVAAAVVDGTSEATVVSVGDSRGYLVTPTSILRLTRDHSLVAERVAAGLITPDEARTSPDRAVLIRAVGESALVAVDVAGPGHLRPGEMLLLCSDGLHGMLDDDHIATVACTSPPDSLGAVLVEAANAAGGEDNISVVIITTAETVARRARRGPWIPGSRLYPGPAAWPVRTVRGSEARHSTLRPADDR